MRAREGKLQGEAWPQRQQASLVSSYPGEEEDGTAQHARRGVGSTAQGYHADKSIHQDTGLDKVRTTSLSRCSGQERYCLRQTEGSCEVLHWRHFHSKDMNRMSLNRMSQ